MIRLAEPIDHPHSIAVAHEAAGILRLLMGDWARARPLFESAIICGQAGEPCQPEHPSARLLCLGTAQLGETDAALEQLHECEQLVKDRLSQGFLGRLGWGYYVLGCAYLKLGRLDEAKRFGDLAVEGSSSSTWIRSPWTPAAR